MHLPFLSLSIGETATRRWLRAVGERPDLPAWKRVGRRKHAWLHNLAVAADGYESVYEEAPAKALMAQDRYSVEHVVPRSKIDDASDAESDPFAWVMASRKANARRSNYPLKLWPDAPWEIVAENSFQVIDGEIHYVPPADQRARLARKFLYAHATYPHDTDTPSVAQLRHLGQIVRLVHDYPIQKPEQQVANALNNLLGYRNPLLTQDAPELLETLDWEALLRGA